MCDHRNMRTPTLHTLNTFRILDFQSKSPSQRLVPRCMGTSHSERKKQNQSTQFTIVAALPQCLHQETKLQWVLIIGTARTWTRRHQGWGGCGKVLRT